MNHLEEPEFTILEMVKLRLMINANDRNDNSHVIKSISDLLFLLVEKQKETRSNVYKLAELVAILSKHVEDLNEKL